jgi:hypothetical protein
MTEVIVAVYNTASAAEIAMADLAIARVPTTTVRQFVSDPAADEELLEVPERSEPSSANMCGIGRADISTTDLSRTIGASRVDVDRCLD